MIDIVLRIIFLLILISGFSHAGQIAPPGGVYYHRFISDVDGPEATWINPACLGYIRTINLQYIGEYSEKRIFKNWAANITGDNIGIAYRKLDDFHGDELQEYIFAVGRGFGLDAYLGASYRYIKKGPAQYNKRHYWNIGMVIRENPNFTAAAFLSNLNRNRIDGIKSDIEQKYSITVLSPKQRLSLSVEIGFTTSQSLSGASYTYGAKYKPLENLTAYFRWDNHSNLELGINFDLIRYFVGAQTRLDGEGEHQGTSLFAGGDFLPKR